MTQTDVPTPVTQFSQPAGQVFELLPAGPTPAPATLTFSLDQPVPDDQGIAIATSDSPTGPWAYLPATLDASRQVATVTVDHFSFFAPVRVFVKVVQDIFKKEFMDAFTGGLFRNLPPAQCKGDPATGGYGASAKSTETVTWCLGFENGKNILRLTNTRRYPLQVQHPKLTVVEPGSLWNSWSKLSTLSRWGSGSMSMVGAGDSSTYAADLKPGEATTLTTDYDGYGMALSTLQVGVETALLFLASPAAKTAAEGVRNQEVAHAGYELLDAMSNSGKCVQAVTDFATAWDRRRDPNLGALLVDCFAAAAEDIPAFGLLMATSTVGGLVAFFTGSASALYDVVTKQDRVAITVRRFWVLDTSGLGPIKLGAKFSELQRAGWVVPPDQAPSRCWGSRGSPALTAKGVRLFESIGADPTLIMIQLDRPGISTRSGAEVGMTLKQVRQIYATTLRIETKQSNGGPMQVAIVRVDERELIFTFRWGVPLTDTAKVESMIVRDWDSGLFGEC